MTWVLAAYWVCFGVGTVYALVSAILTGFFGFMDGGGVDGDAGFDVDHEFGVEAGDAGGHGEAFASVGEGEPMIAPLSPATIAVFLATFGGTGVITTSVFNFPVFISVPVSAAVALAVAAVVFVMFYRFFSAVQASSEPRMAEAVGAEGEVTVTVPREGVGQVAYVVRGARLTASARSQDGAELPTHTAVRIARRIGSTLYVTALTGEESRETAPSDGGPGLSE
jgi:membrane protein implicated in regulation of membrane protease activity